MPSGGSTCPSPRGGVTAHRRRVVDLIPDGEKTPTTELGDDACCTSHHKNFAGALLNSNNIVNRIFHFSNSMKSRKNMGRTILGGLILLLVVSTLIKISFVLSSIHYNLDIISGNNNNGRRLNRLFIPNAWAPPLHQTQLVMAAQEDEFSSMPKRVPENYPVSFLVI